MSLVPDANDPNRKAELARRTKDPTGYDTNHVPSSSQEDARQTAIKEEAARLEQEGKAAAEAEALAAWAEDVADMAVGDAIAQVTDATDDQLHALRAVEESNKNRVTLIAAIDEEVQLRTQE